MRTKRVWVDFDFAKMLKMKASENDKDIISYTRELTKEANRLQGKKINDNFWKIL